MKTYLDRVESILVNLSIFGTVLYSEMFYAECAVNGTYLMQFEAVISYGVRKGFIVENGKFLHWIGPEVDEILNLTSTARLLKSKGI